MIDWPNVTASGHRELGLKPEELQKSKCVLGFIPVIYYSILLCVGVPGTGFHVHSTDDVIFSHPAESSCESSLRHSEVLPRNLRTGILWTVHLVKHVAQSFKVGLTGALHDLISSTNCGQSVN